MDLDHLYAHVVSLGAVLLAALGYAPGFAALAAGLFYVLQIWESKTVREWRGVNEDRVTAAKKAVADAKAALVVATATLAAASPGASE